MMTDDGTVNIISQLYREFTGNQFRETDRAAALEISQYDQRVIRAGIIVATARCKGRVNSLKYCIPVIHEMASMSPHYVDRYAAYALSKRR
jgi:hypothetical protein